MKDEAIDDRYFRIDEFLNALDYLEKALQHVRSKDDPYYMKWVAMSLSQALYGIMICALKWGNVTRVIDFKRMPKLQKEEVEKLRECSESDTETYIKLSSILSEYARSDLGKLISFREALKRVQDLRWMG